EANPDVDARFEMFMKTVHERHPFANGSGPACTGPLLAGIRTFATRMLEYMQGIYDVLDEPLLDDFKKSLFKAFAFNSGLRLATGMVRGSQRTRETLQEFCAGLRHSI